MPRNDSASTTTPWIRVFHPNPAASIRLFCIPFVGGAASVFSEWGKGWNHVEVCPVQLPGRERRFHETPLTSMDAAVEALQNELPFDKPFVFFGHSLGAMISFELTRALLRNGNHLPRHLILSGCPAPQVPIAKRTRHLLPDEEFVAHIRTLGGTPEEILRDKELRML